MPIVGSFAGASSRAYGLQAGIIVGDFESIASTTVGAGGASDITFSSIPSTYTHLQIRGIARTSRTNYSVDDLFLQFNADTGNNYSVHHLLGDGSGAASYSAASSNYLSAGQVGTNLADSGMFGVVVIDILDYANTNKYKTLRALAGIDINGNPTAQKYGIVHLSSGNWRNTNAITSIKIYGNNGPTLQQYTSLALYGVKA